MTIDPSKAYTATIHLEKGGEIVIELFPREAPVTVNSFVFLSREGFYDGVTFHRVLPGFMAQGGDPTGIGTGGPGYAFDNEPSSLRRHDVPGVLSMANAGVRDGKGTNGSQFFITFGPTPGLDGYNADGTPKDCAAPRTSCHTVFGKVIEGMDVVSSISLRDPGTARGPGDAMRTISIEESEPPPAARPAAVPTPTAQPAVPSPTTQPAEAAVNPKPKQYSSPPPMTIDENKNYTATIHLEKGGEIVIELFPKEATVTVNSFVFLSREGYYDGVTFHRVLAGFMAQGGDPTGTGGGGPGYNFDNEPSPLRRHDSPGTLSMANAGTRNGKGTNGSQFFITFVPTPFLDGNNPDGSPKNCSVPGTSCHTVFGKVIEGMDVVNSISPRDPAAATTPGDAMRTITIEESE